MAKREKKKHCPPLATWMVTFSDLVTLLLTFFVLLLSMSSMDNSVLTTVTLRTGDLGLLARRGAGRVTAKKERLVVDLMERPWDILDKKDRIKDLLFPDQSLPEEVNRAELMSNLEVLARPEGVGLALSDKMLFVEGQSELTPPGKAILGRLVPLLNASRAPVNLRGYSDTAEAPDRAFELSGDRALSVLEFFVSKGVPNQRFSVSAYGPNLPLAGNATPEGRQTNRRVEIYMKTALKLGAYIL
ncbi:MAG: OmpA family protein [Desulfovibrionaceae bacterium]|nr:OmpA family protein [Desulfovibrionaceae bacterium]